MEFAAAFNGSKESILSIKRLIEGGNRLTVILVDRGSANDNMSDYEIEKFADVFSSEIVFTDTSIEDKFERVRNSLMMIKAMGMDNVSFSDIDIQENIAFNNDVCDSLNLKALHPLMLEDKEELIKEFLNSGLTARIKNVDFNKIDIEYEGKTFDDWFVDYLKEIGKVDICGEDGSYSTVIDIGPLNEVFKRKIYVDNASTCYPKAIGVTTAVSDFVEKRCYSINRGTYSKSYELTLEVVDIREKLKGFLNALSNYSCVFGGSATESINMLLRGTLKEGDEIIVDDRMHNATWRTIEYLKQFGINLKIWENKGGKYDIEDLKALVTENTKMLFLTLVDNVLGRPILDETLMEEIPKLCKKNNIVYVVDAVQAACEIKLDIQELKVDAMILSAHIGFMALEGLSMVVGSDKYLKSVRPLIFGGTGSNSNSPQMPDSLPDRLEAGTLNLPAIISLGAAIDDIYGISVDKIINKKCMLGKLLREKLRETGLVDVNGYGSFCSISAKNLDDAILCMRLDTMFGIMTRVGIHCSPCTHMAEGSFPYGNVRMSLGYYNNKNDVSKIVKAVTQILG